MFIFSQILKLDKVIQLYASELIPNQNKRKKIKELKLKSLLDIE